MDDKTNIDTTQIERRHLTVLECDLVGSTALAHKLDPEELRDLILGYQDCVLSWIDKLDGYFVQFAGDAIWVYFGYPKAHEDDAIRAIQAGLGMTKSCRVNRAAWRITKCQGWYSKWLMYRWKSAPAIEQ